MKAKKMLRRIKGLGWWREKLRKHKYGAVALGAAVGGMKMLLTHGMFGAEDIIIPILGAIGGGALTKIGIELVDDGMERKQDEYKYRLVRKEVRLLTQRHHAEESGVQETVADKASGVHRTL